MAFSPIRFAQLLHALLPPFEKDKSRRGSEEREHRQKCVSRGGSQNKSLVVQYILEKNVLLVLNMCKIFFSDKTKADSKRKCQVSKLFHGRIQVFSMKGGYRGRHCFPTNELTHSSTTSVFSSRQKDGLLRKWENPPERARGENRPSKARSFSRQGTVTPKATTSSNKISINSYKGTRLLHMHTSQLQNTFLTLKGIPECNIQSRISITLTICVGKYLIESLRAPKIHVIIFQCTIS